MHFIIVGSGRVGRLLAGHLAGKDHTVSVISTNQPLLDLLPQHPNITPIDGVSYDLDVLKRAGIDNCFGFASVTDDDNINILASRIAKSMFNVEKVAVRVYDQSKASIFERFGIPTVSTIHWTVDNILREMIPIGADSQFVDSTGKVVLSQVDYDPSWVGHKVSSIEKLANIRVAYIRRFGESFVPNNDDILQDSDRLHLMLPVAEKDRIANLFSRNISHAYNSVKKQSEDNLQGNEQESDN